MHLKLEGCAGSVMFSELLSRLEALYVALILLGKGKVNVLMRKLSKSAVGLFEKIIDHEAGKALSLNKH